MHIIFYFFLKRHLVNRRTPVLVNECKTLDIKHQHVPRKAHQTNHDKAPIFDLHAHPSSRKDNSVQVQVAPHFCLAHSGMGHLSGLLERSQFIGTWLQKQSGTLWWCWWWWADGKRENSTISCWRLDQQKTLLTNLTNFTKWQQTTSKPRYSVTESVP